jgi:hypothetical protein
MSKLNQSLLFLNKIENGQFTKTHIFDFKTLVELKMSDWQELWQGRNLKIHSSLHSTQVIMNEQLADILLNNLFSNAAYHSAEGGSVYLKLEERYLQFQTRQIMGRSTPGNYLNDFQKQANIPINMDSDCPLLNKSPKSRTKLFLIITLKGSIYFQFGLLINYLMSSVNALRNDTMSLISCFDK